MNTEPLTEAEIWGDTEPVTYYPEPVQSRNSTAAKKAAAERGNVFVADGKVAE